MVRGIYTSLKGSAIMAAWVLTSAFGTVDSVAAAASTKKEQQEVAALKKEDLNRWQEFYSSAGKCTMHFPKYPEHLSEKMRLPKEGFDLKYDAYISAVDQKTVFLLLVAQYPEFVDESYAKMSLEGFLNGILTHNPNNQLIFADLVLVEGREALDFFIRTGGVYFKGRALMVKNSLYLMAMECEVKNYDETNYNKFVQSFTLSK